MRHCDIKAVDRKNETNKRGGQRLERSAMTYLMVLAMATSCAAGKVLDMMM